MPASDALIAPGERRRAELVLVRAAKDGDENASSQLIQKYRGLVRCKARSYFITSGDRDDIIQEGMIGLYKAIRDYDPQRQRVFEALPSCA